MRLNRDVIQGFIGSVLAAKFDGAVATPDFHRELWDLCTGPDKYVAIAAPRRHAKTTAITVSYGLSCLLFRQRSFMLLVSDTESQASKFLAELREHLQENQALIELFGLKRDEKGLVRFVKDTETDIIVELEDGHKFRVIAKGAEQKLRGLIWRSKRPDIIICDDMENDELVMNKERREKMRNWFYSALLPCISSTGIIRVVGTILHMDSLLERLMPKPFEKWSHVEPLRLWSDLKKGGWRSVKYRAHTDDFSEILWESLNSKAFFLEQREAFMAMNLPDKYSQEFLNIPLDEASAYFKRNDFDAISDEDRKLPLKYYITADLAISEASRADYSVFIIGGMDEHRRLQVRQVIRERMDGREIVETLLHLHRIYDPEVVGIEEMQVSKAIGPFLREEMVRQNTYLNLFPIKHNGKDKIARARSIQARMRAKSVKFDKQADWYPTFEDELSRFPRDTHDDQVDAFAYLGLLLDRMIQAPTVEEQEEDAYLDELYEHELDSGSGRNIITGY